MPGADAESVRRVQDRQRGIDRLPVHERLTHPHEHDVGRSLAPWIRIAVPRTCPAISNGSRLRGTHRSVAQKALCSAQPAQEMHSVRRLPSGRHGLDRLPVRQPEEEFCVPSDDCWCVSTMRPRHRASARPTAGGVLAAGSFISSKSLAGCCQSRCTICRARYAGSPAFGHEGDQGLVRLFGSGVQQVDHQRSAARCAPGRGNTQSVPSEDGFRGRVEVKETSAADRKNCCGAWTCLSTSRAARSIAALTRGGYGRAYRFVGQPWVRSNRRSPRSTSLRGEPVA